MSKAEIDHAIRTSVPGDAEHITEAFRDEYVKYYGKYVDDEELEAFIGGMLDDLSEGQRPEELVRTVELGDEFAGAGAIKFRDNLAELGSTIILPENRNTTLPGGEGLYEKLFRERKERASEMVDNPEDPVELLYTQLLADKSAATQHVADKNDFAVTGVYDKKFPVAYEGKGRVTVVDMLWGDSHIENEQHEVYVPDNAVDVVRAARDNINAKRSREHDIEREIEAGYADAVDQRYDVQVKVVEDPMNFAEIQVVASDDGDSTWYDVRREIAEAEDALDSGEDDYWLGISLDANQPYCISAGEELESMGFEYAGFNPGKLEAGDENRDSLEMQYRPSTEKYDKEFVNEAVRFIEEAGIEHGRSDEETDHWNSKALRI